MILHLHSSFTYNKGWKKCSQERQPEIFTGDCESFTNAFYNRLDNGNDWKEGFKCWKGRVRTARVRRGQSRLAVRTREAGLCIGLRNLKTPCACVRRVCVRAPAGQPRGEERGGRGGAPPRPYLPAFSASIPSCRCRSGSSCQASERCRCSILAFVQRFDQNERLGRDWWQNWDSNYRPSSSPKLLVPPSPQYKPHFCGALPSVRRQVPRLVDVTCHRTVQSSVYLPLGLSGRAEDKKVGGWALRWRKFCTPRTVTGWTGGGGGRVMRSCGHAV